MAMAPKDRRSNMPNSSVKVLPKKAGVGGSYAWGDAKQTADYQPIGLSNHTKVTTQVIAQPVIVGRTQSFRGDVSCENQFPCLAKEPTAVETAAVDSVDIVTVPQPWKIQLQEKAQEYAGKAQAFVKDVQTRTMAVSKDRKVQTTVASAAGGTVILGFCGGAAGVLAGGVAGGVAGLPFVLFTFGLSVPLSAAIGAGVVGASGVAVGGSTGCATGGAAGYAAFTWRNEIVQMFSGVFTKVKAARDATKSRAVQAYTAACARVSTLRASMTATVRSGANVVKQKVLILTSATTQVVKDPRAQVTAASATLGGVTVGGAGGVVGLAGGGITGAVVGVVPAFFTFGLSIPFCAIMGSGAGLCLGTAIGGTTGVIGGGTVGYGVYSRKTEIRQGITRCSTYANELLGNARALTEKRVLAAKKALF